MNDYSLLTLNDVKDYLQMKVAEQQGSIGEIVAVDTEVGSISTPDGDYMAAILILKGSVIIYSDENTKHDLILGRKPIYHLQAWSRAGQEYRHLAKSDNSYKLIKLALILSAGDKEGLTMYPVESRALNDDL